MIRSPKEFGKNNIRKKLKMEVKIVSHPSFNRRYSTDLGFKRAWPDSLITRSGSRGNSNEGTGWSSRLNCSGDPLLPTKFGKSSEGLR